MVHPDDILWWSHGGKLHGESEPRLSFLKKILDETPGGYLKRGQGIFDEVVGIPYDEENEATWTTVRYCSYEIHYYGFEDRHSEIIICLMMRNTGLKL